MEPCGDILAIVGPEGSIFALAKSNAMNMKEMLQAYEKRSPEIVFEWNDAETDARGWVVINSLRGGAAGVAAAAPGARGYFSGPGRAARGGGGGASRGCAR